MVHDAPTAVKACHRKTGTIVFPLLAGNVQTSLELIQDDTALKQADNILMDLFEKSCASQDEGELIQEAFKWVQMSGINNSHAFVPSMML